MKRLRRQAPRLLALALALLLLGWVLSTVSRADVWRTLQQLTPGEIAILAVVNSLILVTFSVRWWIFLGALGHPVPIARLVRYRLTAFGISYFTPGPHFGGEPYQVYAVSKWHGVPYDVSIAAVSLDKLLEMFVNFAFLAIGSLLVLQTGVFGAMRQAQILAVALGLLLLPVAGIAALRAGIRPLSALLDGAARMWRRVTRFSQAAGQPPAWRSVLRNSEDRAIWLCQSRPRAFALATAVSVASWLGIISEFWLMTSMLDLRLTLMQAVTALLAARVAILLPLPAALGALEASQAIAIGSLKLDPAAGVGLSLLIRSRDVLLGMLGLLLGGAPVWRHLRKPSQDMPSVPEKSPEPGAVLLP